MERSLAEMVRRLLDREEIVALLHAYCRHVDRLEPERIASLFTDDCILDYGPGMGGTIRGRANLQERMRGLSRFAATSHHVSNIEIAFQSDDRATGTTYVYALHRFPKFPARPDAHLWGRYHDVFVRTADGWRISERVLRIAGQEEFDIEWYPIGRRGSAGVS